MKSMVLAMAIPAVLLTGCAGYVGEAGPGYPGYYDGYGSPDYYAGGPTYIGFSTYNRGYYHHEYRHDGGDYHRGSAVASRGFSRGGSRVASAGHSAGHSRGASHSAAASVGGGGGGHSGGHGGGHR